jgi:hypothetical protein
MYCSEFPVLVPVVHASLFMRLFNVFRALHINEDERHGQWMTKEVSLPLADM